MDVANEAYVCEKCEIFKIKSSQVFSPKKKKINSTIIFLIRIKWRENPRMI